MLLTFVLLFFIGLLSPALSFAEDVAILSSGNLSVYHQAIEGFRSALPTSTHVQEYVLGQPMTDDRTIGQQIRGSNPDVVLAVGGKAAQLARIEIVDQPVVFCMVLNLEASGLPTANMTGVLMTIPSEQQLASMRTVIPTLQRVGLLYSPEFASFAIQAQRAAKNLELTLVATPIADQQEVPGILRALLPRVEALWLLRDPQVVNAESLNFLIRTALDFNVPVFGFASGLMRHGALATLSLDYRQVGRQAARLTRDIIRRDMAPGALPSPQHPDLPLLALNLNAASFLGLTPSTQTLQLAAELFGGPGAFAKQQTEDPFLIP